jgi:hypothetical protein
MQGELRLVHGSLFWCLPPAAVGLNWRHALKDFVTSPCLSAQWMVLFVCSVDGMLGPEAKTFELNV